MKGDLLWAPDGRELFYRNGNLVMAVSVEKTDPAFRRETPVTLFQGPPSPYIMFDDVITRTSWDIHPDGERFLMMKPDDSEEDEDAVEAPRKINIILNWVEELKQRMPEE